MTTRDVLYACFAAIGMWVLLIALALTLADALS